VLIPPDGLVEFVGVRTSPEEVIPAPEFVIA
jgi:hypothetical protein